LPYEVGDDIANDKVSLLFGVADYGCDLERQGEIVVIWILAKNVRINVDKKTP